ncbi:MAG: hypothetical protein J6W96_05250, partial [Alphaproteobacteria bacterium]|nr:hypothetical protein [Alphaproteobacteria bacterium]
QFCTVMISIILLAYFGGLPKIFEVLALTYLGSMIAFLFFSWPPEKLIISHGAFVSLGFIMGCFMLSATTEFAGPSMIIAVSYLITEVGIALYNHFIIRDDQPELYMSTSYYKSSNQGEFEKSVVYGVFKILFIDIILSLAQISASDYVALPIFTIILNLWFLSILSGDTKPEELLSITKLGKKAIWGIFSKKKDKK